MTVRALRSTALRIGLLATEAAGLRAELERLVTAVAPSLLEFPGVGPITAAQVLVSWSYAGPLRSEAAFAALAGANPIPASSGQVTRHRLPEPRRRPAAEPRPAHRCGGPAARRPSHPRVRLGRSVPSAGLLA
jgi:transposase